MAARAEAPGAGVPATRQDFEGAPRELLSRGSILKPAVWRVDGAAGPVAVKDSAGLAFWARPLGRWLLRREVRILGRLDGLAVVPQVLGRVDGRAWVLSWVPGRPMDRAAFRTRARELADQLFALIHCLHERGVYHLDLRQRQNVLLDEEGRIGVVDFGAALAPWSPFRALVRPLLEWIDRQAVLKYLTRYAPEELTREEARAVLRAQRWRRVWFVSPHRSRGAEAAARERLSQLDAAAEGEPPREATGESPSERAPGGDS